MKQLVKRPPTAHDDRPGTTYAGVIHDPDGKLVTLPGLDGGRHAVPVIDIPPRGDDRPSRGDRCLVILDDEGDLWVVSWIPGGS